MFAIFDENNYIKNSNILDQNLKSLEIGKDIEWQIIIRRGGQVLDIKKEDLKNNDIILKKYWKIENLEITRNKKRMTIKESDLKENDIIEQKNYSRKSEDDIVGYRICRNGADMQIEVKDMQKGDCIVKEFEKERIYTNNNNEFLLKTDNELIAEYKEKIIKQYAEKIDKQSIIDGTAQTKIDDYQKELDKIDTLDNIKIEYNNVLSKAI